MRIQTIVATAVILFTLIGCSEDRWDGHVYPNRSNLPDSRHIEVFRSLEDCRDAAFAELEYLNSLQYGDYECGKNCRTDSRYGGILICEDTLH